jgi:two-component system sensor histidine kinase TctE
MLMGWLIGGSAMLAILLFVVVRSYAAQVAQNTQDQILEASVTAILDQAAIRNGQLDLELPYAAFSILSTPMDDRVFYALYQDTAFLSGYEQLTRPDAPILEPTVMTTGFNNTPVRVVWASRRLVGDQNQTVLTVAVAQTQEHFASTLRGISRNAALLGLGFFTLTALLSYWVTTATVRKLTRLTQSVQQRGPQDLRPFAKSVPIEMAPLVGSLNTLMGRLDQALKQSENFIAEAAHRVRTPLATVRSHAETTLQRVDKEENRQALRSMVRAIDESSRAAGQLLDHAMITFRADQLQKEPLDLAELAQDLVLRMRPNADMKDVDLNLNCHGPVRIQGDAIQLQNAMRNLVDNALKYAPAETSIDIEVADNPPCFQLRDSGPGFPPGEIGGLAKRFARGSNAGGIIGSGLGLTIVQDVAQAHDGKLILGNHPEGGACVTLSL